MLTTRLVLTRRAVRALALAAVLVMALATSALARTGSGRIVVSNENVTYAGSISWAANSQTSHQGHGGMVVSGYLTDDNCNGHWVYVQAQVEGYGYTTLRTNKAGCGPSHRVWDSATEVYDPAATYVTDGHVKACQSDAFWDTCTTQHEHR